MKEKSIPSERDIVEYSEGYPAKVFDSRVRLPYTGTRIKELRIRFMPSFPDQNVSQYLRKCTYAGILTFRLLLQRSQPKV